MAIHLRPLASTDWEAVHSWAQCEDACRYQAWGPNTPEQTQEFVNASAARWTEQPQTHFFYAVEIEDRVQALGVLALRSSSEGEIVYSVHPELWGRGLGTEIGLEALLIRDGWRDSDFYSILEHEWDGR